MKKLIYTVGFGLLLGLFACDTTEEAIETPTEVSDLVNAPNPEPDSVTTSTKKIKLAILLDTSGSMDGLIEQAKNQLWKIVNQLAKATDEEGKDPEIEIALYQYGNDGLSMYNGYVEQIYGFTSELDEISEKLFALTTNGGSEFCGRVIKTSLDELTWSDSDEDLQLIFIAGNEPFTQGDVSYHLACASAKQSNVIVNTIFCGDYNEGINTYWKDGAVLTNGKYLNIDHDAQIVHIDSPYDKDISALNSKLNDTYVPYGSQGSVKKQKQLTQDANAQSLGYANSTKRIMSKGSKVYKNTSWDLVDASKEKGFKISDVKNSTLPKEMQTMNTEQKKAYVDKKRKERESIKLKIKGLGVKRDKYVANEKLKSIENSSNQFDDAIISSIVEQAESKAFKFENDVN